jgi:hypothetical protein
MIRAPGHIPLGLRLPECHTLHDTVLRTQMMVATASERSSTTGQSVCCGLSLPLRKAG